MSPLLETFASASKRGWEVTALGKKYWMANFEFGGSVTPYSFGTDVFANLIVTALPNTAAPQQGWIAKVNKFGSAVAYQWNQTNASSSVLPAGAGGDYLGNTLSVFSHNLGAYVLIMKTTDAGAITWQRTFTTGTAVSAVATTSTSDIFFANTSYGQGPIDVVRYNNSGTIQWQRRLANPNGSNAVEIGVDQYANVYVYAQAFNGTTQGQLLFKYNSSGTLQWQRTNHPSTSWSFSVGGGAAFDYASGTSYIIANPPNSLYGYNSVFVSKIDSAGAYVWSNIWQTQSLGGGPTPQNSIIGNDAAGNVYFACWASSTPNSLYIIKLNSSGTKVWERLLTVNAGNGINVSPTSGPIIINETDSAFSFALYTSGGTKVTIVRLPTDGTSTGSWTNGGLTWTYATTAIWSTTGPLNAWTNSAYTASTPTHTDAAGAISIATATRTYTKTDIA